MDYIKDAFNNCDVVSLKGGRYCVNTLTDHVPATDSKLLSQIIDEAVAILDPVKNNYDIILGEEDRGGYIAALVAFHLSIPFTLVKWNPGGLEGDIAVNFRNLYTDGKMYVNSVKKGDRVLIVEDIIDTGGTLSALYELINARGAKVKNIFTVAAKEDYEGLKKVTELTGITPDYLVSFNTKGGKSNVISRRKKCLTSYSDVQYQSKNVFYKNHEKMGGANFEKIFDYFSRINITHKKVLDLGCGEGNDLSRLRDMQAQIYGVDINPAAIEQAHRKFPEDSNNIYLSDISSTPFEDNYFDIISSNYVLQAVEDIDAVYLEIARILKKNGKFIFIATHPMRQYFERKKINADYFESEIVNSVILDGSVVVQEPTHTMNDFMSPALFENFNLVTFEEVHDPLAESVHGRTYPGFIIMELVKK